MVMKKPVTMNSWSTPGIGRFKRSIMAYEMRMWQTNATYSIVMAAGSSMATWRCFNSTLTLALACLSVTACEGSLLGIAGSR